MPDCRTEVRERGDGRGLYCVTHDDWVFNPGEDGLNPEHTIVRPVGFDSLDLPPGLD